MVSTALFGLIKVQLTRTGSSPCDPKQITTLSDYCKMRADCVCEGV